MTGKHRARLTASNRAQLQLAIANGYYDHTAADRVAAVVETILDHHAERARLLDRECDVLAQALERVGAYPMDHPRTPDGIRAWAHAHAVAGTTIEKDGD